MIENDCIQVDAGLREMYELMSAYMQFDEVHLRKQIGRVAYERLLIFAKNSAIIRKIQE